MKKKYTKKQPTKKLHIYIESANRYDIKKLCEKYKISMSCLIRNLYTTITKYLDKIEINNLGKELLLKNKYQTTIKPREIVNIYETKEELTNYLSNITYLYITKKLKTKINNDKYIKFNNELNRKLTNEKEIWWDLNNTIRMRVRADKILGVNKQ